MLRVTTRDHAPFGAAAPRHAGVVVPYALRGHLEPYSASVRSTGRMGAMVEMACL